MHRGYDGCLSHHRFPQAKLFFPLGLSKKNINPFPLHDLPGIPTLFLLVLFRLFSQMFFPSFFLPQKLREGFCRDSSDCSIRALPISWPLNNSLLSFWNACLYFLLIIEDGICNVTLRLVKHALLFPSGLLHYYHHDFCSHPHTDLSFTNKL